MPIDTSIYNSLMRPVKSIADYDAEYETAQGNKLARLLQGQQIAQGKMKMDEYGRGVERQNQLRTMMGGMGGATDEQRITALRGGAFFDEADKLETGILARQKTGADVGKVTAETGKINLEAAHKRLDILGSVAGHVKDNPTPESAIRAAEYLAQQGLLTPEQLAASVAKIQADPSPETIRASATQVFQSALSAKDQLPRTQTTNLGGSMRYESVSPVTGQVTQTGQQSITESEAQRLARERQAADAAAGRAVTMRGQNMTDARSKEANARADANAEAGKWQYDAARGGLVNMKTGEFKPATQDGKPIGTAAKPGGPMSVTLQKELLESDDVVQAAGNIVKSLEAAKKQNEQAYSGYFAKTRAQLASNFVPGSTESADASIDIDNLMTGGALEQLKTVFGGMPTEGERKILLEMQASLDKTPKQREAIMDRAIALAQKRARYAAEKAKAIRSGKYLTEGAQEPQAPGVDVNNPLLK